MMPGHTQHNYQMDTNEYIPNTHSPQQQHQQQQHLYSESDVQDSTAGVESKTDWQEALGPSQTGYDEAWEDLKSRLESGALGGDAQTSSSDYQFSSGNDYFQAMSNDIIAAEQLSASTNSNHTEDIIDGMFEKAMDLYRAGKLRDAVLAFEAVVQHERGKEHDEAWRMLGTCHAENDEDKKAIQCLNKALKCDPYNLDALLSLGTSYVNELDSVRALQTLRTWVSHNPRFQGLEVVQDEYSDGTLMDEVMQLMLAVAEFSPSDPQVQVVLGVLYNVSLDYDSAVECFTKAMAENQSDYSVINKVSVFNRVRFKSMIVYRSLFLSLLSQLAASYANNNQSDLAIPHYAKVLELRPTFARGWLNLGISHANMDQYDQAARSYLQALHLNPAAK